jgi:hypothetical protein
MTACHDIVEANSEKTERNPEENEAVVERQGDS